MPRLVGSDEQSEAHDGDEDGQSARSILDAQVRFMLLALLLAITAADVKAEMARVEQAVAAAELRRTQAERDLLTRRAAPRATMLRNEADLRAAQERVRAAAQNLQEREEP